MTRISPECFGMRWAEHHHGVYGHTSEGVPQKNTQRASLGECTPNTQEETRTNRPSQRDELDVA